MKTPQNNLKYSFTAVNISQRLTHRELNTAGVEALLQNQDIVRNSVNKSKASSSDQQNMHTCMDANSDYYTYKNSNNTNGDTSESNSSNNESQQSSDGKPAHNKHIYTADYQLIEENIMEESVNGVNIEAEGDIVNDEYDNDNGDTTCVGILLKRCQANTANGLKNPHSRTRRETT